MYVIEGDYGEYDDYNKIAFLVVPDVETAQIVVEELYNPNGEFKDLVEKHFGHILFDDLGFSYKEVAFFSMS